jgi:hypothetical protein
MSLAVPLIAVFFVGVVFLIVGWSDRTSRGLRHLGGFGFGLCVWSALVLVLLLLSTKFDPQDGCAADICGTWGPFGFVALFLGWPIAVVTAAVGLPAGSDAGEDTDGQTSKFI